MYINPPKKDIYIYISLLLGYQPLLNRSLLSKSTGFAAMADVPDQRVWPGPKNDGDRPMTEMGI